MEKKTFKIAGIVIIGIILIVFIIYIMIYFSESNVVLPYYCNGLYKVTGECNGGFCHPIDRCIEGTIRIRGMMIFCDKEVIGCAVADSPNGTQLKQSINIESKQKNMNFLDIPI